MSLGKAVIFIADIEMCDVSKGSVAGLVKRKEKSPVGKSISRFNEVYCTVMYSTVQYITVTKLKTSVSSCLSCWLSTQQLNY